MKPFILLLLSLLFFTTCNAQKDSIIDFNPIEELQVKELKIEYVIAQAKQAYKEQEQRTKLNTLNTRVVILGIKEIKNFFDVRISFLSENNVQYCLEETKQKIYGFYTHDSNMVLVFGKDAAYFFLKNHQLSSFSFLKLQAKKKLIKGEIELLPIILEPEVWVYNLKKGNFILKEKGMLKLLID